LESFIHAPNSSFITLVLVFSFRLSALKTLYLYLSTSKNGAKKNYDPYNSEYEA
jgi:hypothetical protein